MSPEAVLGDTILGEHMGLAVSCSPFPMRSTNPRGVSTEHGCGNVTHRFSLHLRAVVKRALSPFEP